MKEIPRNQFLDEVNQLLYYDLKELSDFLIDSPSMTGCFYKEDLPYLKEYCKNHPEFHICCFAEDDVYYNAIRDQGVLFFLCKGNSDPELFCRLDWGKIGQELSRGFAIMFSSPEMFSELDEIENYSDTITLKN